ncbi:MAG TPA: antibiotic biosynthesis monooxygenase family protein [Actinoplanes sp.]|nr:antibiotic biosynthesis monooxygenase family protein [Actinoplanes sp.]
MSHSQTTISVQNHLVTLMNVFTCPEDRQNALVAALDEATVELFVKQPGFISANIHASLDRTRVVNYAQWASQDAFEITMGRQDVREHMAEIMTIASSADPRLFTVRATHHAS